MHLINHNLNVNIIPIGDGVLISDFANAPTTNNMKSCVNQLYKEIDGWWHFLRILAHANGCAAFSLGRAPNFVLADYINVGETMKAVDRLNGF